MTAALIVLCALLALAWTVHVAWMHVAHESELAALQTHYERSRVQLFYRGLCIFDLTLNTLRAWQLVRPEDRIPRVGIADDLELRLKEPGAR